MPAPVSSLIPTATTVRKRIAATDPQVPTAVWQVLSTISDPRGRRGRRHELATVLLIALCAVLCGARSLAAVADWARDSPRWCWPRLGVARATPSLSKIRRVLLTVDADVLDAVLHAWLAALDPRPQSASEPAPTRRCAVAVAAPGRPAIQPAGRLACRTKRRCAARDRSAVSSHVKKHDITAEVVTCLLREQFPHLAHLPVTPMAVDGWDNSSFRIGSDHTARLPTDEGYVPAVAKEHQWLPVLGPQLPLPIPAPVALGAPGCGFPRPWSVYRWLPGDTASIDRVTGLDTFGHDVARFLTALWAVDPESGPAAGDHSFGRGGPLSRYDADVHACLDALPAHINPQRVLDTWDAALSSSFAAEPCWFHGDMAPSNLLVRDGRLAAVIDFGTCGVGDPACDLVIAWTFLDTDARHPFRQQLDVDRGTWARGRGWALWKALLTLREADPDAAVRRYGWRQGAADIITDVTDDR